MIDLTDQYTGWVGRSLCKITVFVVQSFINLVFYNMTFSLHVPVQNKEATTQRPFINLDLLMQIFFFFFFFFVFGFFFIFLLMQIFFFFFLLFGYYLFIYLFIYLSIYLFIVCLFVCLFVCSITRLVNKIPQDWFVQVQALQDNKGL